MLATCANVDGCPCAKWVLQSPSNALKAGEMLTAKDGQSLSVVRDGRNTGMAKQSFIDGIQVLTHKNHLEVTLCLSCIGGEDCYTEVSLARDEHILAFAAAGIKEGMVRYDLLPSPVQFWHPKSPSLYELAVRLLDSDGSEMDSKSIHMGFRDALFCAEGFFLNGQMICPAVMDLTAKAANPQELQPLKARQDVNLVLCRIDKNTSAFLAECDRQGTVAAAVFPRGYGRADISRAILQLGWHPALCAWVVEELSWGKKIAPQLAKEDPSRALLHLERKTGRILILGGKGEKTQLAGGIALVD